MADYQITVTAHLPETMEETPLMVLNSVVLGALQEADIPVLHVQSAKVLGSDD